MNILAVILTMLWILNNPIWAIIQWNPTNDLCLENIDDESSIDRNRIISREV